MNHRVLYKTDKLVISHFHEYTVLKDVYGNLLLEDDFYGEPSCGLISENNDWAIIAGHHFTFWINGAVAKIENADIRWVQSMRCKSDYLVEILIDPWSEKSAIWEFNLKTLNFEKIKDFTDYRDKEYTDDVSW